MSRESKIFKSEIGGVEKTIYKYESFGWELLSLNGDQIVMTRETQNPVYADLVRNQEKYEQLIKDHENVSYPKPPAKPESVNPGLCFLLLLLLIAPGVFYIRYKMKESKQYKEALAAHKNEIAACDKKKADILAEMEQLLLDSRTLFFSKQ